MPHSLTRHLCFVLIAFLGSPSTKSILCPVSGAALWGLILNNPLPGDGFASNVAKNSRIPSAALEEASQVNLTWIRNLHGNSTDDPLPVNNIDGKTITFCKSDEECSEDMFCDHHYGYCDRVREEGELCRKDEQCKKGLECLFGKCIPKAKPGQRGSRCTSENDCEPNLCCAREHGEKICKPKIARGQKCYVPEGGLEYVLNEMCPCESGLVCKKVTKDEEALAAAHEDKTQFGAFWKIDMMRCVEVHH